MGSMARALLVFKENAVKVQNMQAEREALETASRQEKTAAMARLADDRGLARRLGEAGFERAALITWDGVVERLVG
jgi:hypothetical protein